MRVMALLNLLVFLGYIIPRSFDRRRLITPNRRLISVSTPATPTNERRTTPFMPKESLSTSTQSVKLLMVTLMGRLPLLGIPGEDFFEAIDR
jgi:hypothetical protein